MADIYSQEFLHHYKNQPHHRKLPHASASAKSENLSCGDAIELQLEIKNNVITDIGYESDGCAVSLGAMSLLSDFLQNKRIDDVRGLSQKDFLDLLHVELTPSREKCALVGYSALISALETYDSKKS